MDTITASNSVKDLHVSSKVIIVRNDSILLAEYQDKDSGETGFHYNLPGGRIRPNETLQEAAKRKAMEEVGADVVIGSLVIVYEYIGINHGCQLGDKHSVSIIFLGRLVDEHREPRFQEATDPDDIQVGIRWVSLQELNHIVLWPRIAEEVRDVVIRRAAHDPVYLGDIV